ncbi:MAG: hypothetical protein LBS32_03995 [Clostridiales Family XIII bacterium]|jgi:hypothetical protein|nr:hypothetical protein [Clostridiales Family XIII bacterium]
MEAKGMDGVKKAGILAGALVGGVIGGSVSVIGKLARVRLVDEIGESIVDSGIYTGSVVGNIAGGAIDAVVGKVANDSERFEGGVGDIKEGGRQVVDNLVDNVKLVVENGGEMLAGAAKMDGKRAARGARTLAKVVAVGAITVGAIRVKKPDPDGE